MTEALDARPDRKHFVGRNIASARRSAGMSQEDLANLVGVPRTYISDWERGRHKPRDGSWERLEAALGRSYGWLHTDHGLEDGQAA